MKTLKNLLLAHGVIAGCLLFTACEQPAAEQDPAPASDPATTSPPVAQRTEVAPGELNYADAIAPPGAKVKVGSRPFGYAAPTAALKLTPSVDHNKLMCEYRTEVTDFDLGARTRDAGERGCYDDPKGQYVHVIVNNRDQYDVRDAAFAVPVNKGRDYVLSFLARSYGESVKDLNAFQNNELVVAGDPGGEPKFFWGQEATLFYYRPYGTYSLGEGKLVLLDFYLLNCTPAPGGYGVRATIDGDAFLLMRWAPYFIEGLAPGEHTVRLELLDPSGKLVPGPYNDSGVRTFNVTG